MPKFESVLICDDCWDAQRPDTPSRRDGDNDPEPCHLCGKLTCSGIFIRVDLNLTPAAKPFPRWAGPATAPAAAPTQPRIECKEHEAPLANEAFFKCGCRYVRPAPAQAAKLTTAERGIAADDAKIARLEAERDAARIAWQGCRGEYTELAEERDQLKARIAELEALIAAKPGA